MIAFLNIFIPLLISHTLIDFYCQPLSWVKDKEKKGWRSHKLVHHAILHSAAACIVMLIFTADILSVVTLVSVIAISHWAIDLMKVMLGKKLRYLIMDQLLHVAILALLAMHASAYDINVALTSISSAITPKYMIIALAYLLVLKPSSILISTILAKYSPIEAGENKGLLSGGELIGYLERLLILTFVIKGQFVVIGFILAAKSIFRFGDLNNAKHRNLTEYVLLGSLLSVTITSFLGLLVTLK